MGRGRTYLFMALHVTFAAVNYVLAKGATRHFGDAIGALTMLRAAAAAVLLLALTGTVIPRPRFALADLRGVALLGALLMLNQYLFLRGLRDTAPGHAALLYAMTPLGVLLLQSALARRFPPLLKALGVLLALAGVLLVLQPWSQQDPAFREIRTGDLWIGAGAIVWVVATVATVPLVRSHDSRTVTAWSLVAGAVMMLPLTAADVAAVDFRLVPADAWWGLASLVLLASCVMMLLWNVLLRHLAPVEVAICTNAQPVVTTVLGALLAALGRPVAHADAGPWFWAGTALVIAGVLLALRPPSRVAAATS